MSCMFEFKLGTSEVIAILALLVGGLSALFARWSLLEARRANKISLLGHRKEICDAFFELKIYMTERARLSELSEVCKFHHFSKNAKFYFPTDLAKNIEKYYEACFWIADIHRRYGGITQDSENESAQYIATERELAATINDEISDLLADVQA